MVIAILDMSLRNNNTVIESVKSVLPGAVEVQV